MPDGAVKVLDAMRQAGRDTLAASTMVIQTFERVGNATGAINTVLGMVASGE